MEKIISKNILKNIYKYIDNGFQLGYYKIVVDNNFHLSTMPYTHTIKE